MQVLEDFKVDNEPDWASVCGKTLSRVFIKERHESDVEINNSDVCSGKVFNKKETRLVFTDGTIITIEN